MLTAREASCDDGAITAQAGCVGLADDACRSLLGEEYLRREA
jgi:hypothetical protein